MIHEMHPEWKRSSSYHLHVRKISSWEMHLYKFYAKWFFYKCEEKPYIFEDDSFTSPKGQLFRGFLLVVTCSWLRPESRLSLADAEGLVGSRRRHYDY